MSVNKPSLSAVRIAGMAPEAAEIDLKKDFTVEAKKVDPKKLVAPEKIKDIWGACAGAGSDYFHGYRTKREFQLERAEAMAQEEIDETEYNEHQAKRQKMMNEDDAKTNKKRDKRKKRKDAKIRNQSQRELGANINNFKSGNFIEMAKKQLEETKKKGKELNDANENLTAEQIQAKIAVPVAVSKMNNMEENIKIKEVDDDLL